MTIRRKSMLGLETEMYLLNKEGKMVNDADKVLENFKDRKISKFLHIEMPRSVIEMTVVAKRSIKDCAVSFMDNLIEFAETTHELGYNLLPLGTHPGRADMSVRQNSWLDGKRAVIGSDAIKNASRACGFHYHFTMPEGIIEKSSYKIKDIQRSEARRVFLQQYNFLLACDPVMINICQSTPFWQGIHYGKDCRVFGYRDLMVTRGKHLLKGAHYYFPLMGGLPNYEFTLQDLRVQADHRKTEWLKQLEQVNYPTNEIATMLPFKFMWGPLRVNKIGTIEYRGPDMNHPDVVFSASSLLKYSLDAIEKNEYMVKPSDIGISEPFVLEDGIIYVPPFSTLKYLERQSATAGLESPEALSYCKRMIDLFTKITKKQKSKNLKRVLQMIEERRTVSDEMLDLVRKNGYDPAEEVPEDMLNHLALYEADRFMKSLKKTRKLFEKFRD